MLSLGNRSVVTLDACVLLPMPLCDTLLRLAEEPAFYIPCWSQETLEEVRRNLIEKWRYTAEQADRRVRAMRAAFEEAEVTGYESLLPAMTNDPGDRHVLAAAVHAGADAIVSNNVKHFPPQALEPYGIELLTADEFLVSQFHLDAAGVLAKLEAQALKRHCALTDLLRLLGSRGVGEFVKLVADYDE
jgi:predicted nucleic acid-binding protein